MRVRIVSLSIVVLLLTLAFALGVYAGSAGNPEPPGPPGSTSSYTLEDVYNRLDMGAAGTQKRFTEPASGPGTGTMHTLDDIMAVAPAVDDTNGAVPGDVLSGKTFWGLRTGGAWGARTGTRYPAPVPKTGQTLPYGERDDGALEMGVPWPVPRFVTNTTGLVTDTLTGLIWLQDANCMMSEYPDFDEDDTAEDGMVTWEHALLFVAGINAGTYPNCGEPFTDWRLPNVRELQSLIHYGFRKPALPDTAGAGQWSEGDPFTGVQSEHYWSSTTKAPGSSYAWIVDMDHGHPYFDPKTPYDYYVWPVRGGQ